MDNRGEIVDEKDRKWILRESGGDGQFLGDLILLVDVIAKKDCSLLSDGQRRAYGIREALIARKMGLSEGSEGRKDAE